MAKKSRQQKDEERRKADEEERAYHARKPVSTKKALSSVFIVMLVMCIPFVTYATLEAYQQNRYANIYGYSRLDWFASAVWILFLVVATYLLLRKTKKIELGEKAWRRRRNSNIFLAAFVGLLFSIFFSMFADVVNNWGILGVENRRFRIVYSHIGSTGWRSGGGQIWRLSDSLGRSHMVYISSEKDAYFFGPTNCLELNLNIGLFGGRFADKKIRPIFRPDSDCPDMIYWGAPPNTWYSN